MRSLPPSIARVRSLVRLVAVLLFTTLAAAAQAATLPAGFTETRVATGLSNPTAMAFAPTAACSSACRAASSASSRTAPCCPRRS